MNSPLQGGRMRRSRRGRVIARRTRVAPRLLVLVLLSIVATAVWLVVGEGKTTDSPNSPGPQAVLGDLGTSTRPPGKTRGAALPPGISLFGAKPIRIHFKHPPRAGLVFDLDSGQVVWAPHPLKRLPIASLTKIMTAIIV